MGTFALFGFASMLDKARRTCWRARGEQSKRVEIIESDVEEVHSSSQIIEGPEISSPKPATNSKT